MVTDISFFVEDRQPDGTWHLVDEPIRNPGYYPDDPDSHPDWEIMPHTLDIPPDYTLFSILADMRNRTRGKYFKPISLPRGLPSGLSKIAQNYFDFWEGDAQSPSWLTHADFNSYDGDKAEIKFFIEQIQHYSNSCRFIFWFDS